MLPRVGHPDGELLQQEPVGSARMTKQAGRLVQQSQLLDALGEMLDDTLTLRLGDLAFR